MLASGFKWHDDQEDSGPSPAEAGGDDASSSDSSDSAIASDEEVDDITVPKREKEMGLGGRAPDDHIVLKEFDEAL